jgi:hypothetical protein
MREFNASFGFEGFIAAADTQERPHDHFVNDPPGVERIETEALWWVAGVSWRSRD